MANGLLSVQDAITSRVYPQYRRRTAIPTSSSGPITPIQILPPVDDGLMNIGTRTRQSPSTSELVGFLWLHQLLDLGSNPTSLARSLPPQLPHTLPSPFISSSPPKNPPPSLRTATNQPGPHSSSPSAALPKIGIWSRVSGWPCAWP